MHASPAPATSLVFSLVLPFGPTRTLLKAALGQVAQEQNWISFFRGQAHYALERDGSQLLRLAVRDMDAHGPQLERKTIGNDRENPLTIFNFIFNSKSGMVKGSSVGKTETRVMGRR